MVRLRLGFTDLMSNMQKLFTIHYGEIKTAAGMDDWSNSSEFTIHYGEIKTLSSFAWN